MKILFRTLVILLTCVSVAAYATNATSFYQNFKGLKLVDQHNQPFDFDTLDKHIVIVNFIFTQCSNVCPVQTQSLKQVKQSLPAKLQQNVKFLSVSLDPMHDTPKQLTHFAKRMHVDVNQWTFLTGRPDDIQLLSDRLALFGNAEKAKSLKQPDNHLTTLWLINKQGQLMQRYAGNPVNVQRLSREIQQLNLLNP